MAVVEIDFADDGLVHFVINGDIDNSWVFLDYGWTRMRPCEYCGTADGVTYGPDPFDYDVNDDPTPHFICLACRDERAAEI